MSHASQIAQPPPAPLASDLCWLVNRAGQVLAHEAEKALVDSGLSVREHCVLLMARTGPHTQTELARGVGLDKTTMMVTLDELERAGLAERRPLPTDRRARVVAVTEAGERALARAEAVLDRVREGVLELLGADEREVFMRSLARLACADVVGSACADAVGSVCADAVGPACADVVGPARAGYVAADRARSRAG